MANKLIVNQMPSVLDLSVIKDVNGNPITLRPKDQAGSKREVTSDAVMHEVVQRVLAQQWVRIEPVTKEIDVLEAPLVPAPKRGDAPRAAANETPPAPVVETPPAPPAEEQPPVAEEQPVPVVEEPPAEPPVPEEPPAPPAEEAPAEPAALEEPPAEPSPAIEPEAGSSAKTTAKLRRDRR